jgi:xanthosine utilization system XapX-like protein
MNMNLWGAPVALGFLTLIGLISALLGDGIWDAVSALALGTPVAVSIWYGLRRGRRISGAAGGA